MHVADIPGTLKLAQDRKLSRKKQTKLVRENFVSFPERNVCKNKKKIKTASERENHNVSFLSRQM